MSVIIRIKEHYLEYSTVCDAPTIGMTRYQMRKYLIGRYGSDQILSIDEAIRRAELHGTSEREGTLESTLMYNRAGKDETTLTIKQIYEYYCVGQGSGLKPVGVDATIEDEVDPEDSTIDEDGKILF